MAQHNVIKDKGEYFVIDPNTRTVRVPTTHRVIGTEEDHLSEQITFVCPQFIDEHDISQCGRHYVSWLNTEGTPGHDELKIDRVEDGNVYFAWDIRSGLTLKKGVVQFSVHFEDVSSAGGSRLYKWSTATCSQCEILGSINAALGTYESVYVAGDALVFADYNPVKDSTLTLDGIGALAPDGMITLTENGVHDVARFSQAEVKVLPRLAIDPDFGDITASVNGVVCALMSGSSLVEYDADFVAENIKSGVKIFGLEGTYKHDIPLVWGRIRFVCADGIISGKTKLIVHYSGCEKSAWVVDFSATCEIPHGGELAAYFVKDSIITLQSAIEYSGSPSLTYDAELDVVVGAEDVTADGEQRDIFIVKPTMDNFIVQVLL